MASRYNRLSRPIAVIGNRDAYMHLCEHCKLDPNKNDVFTHVFDYQTACGGPFSRTMEIDGIEDIRDRHVIVGLAKARIINDTTANVSRSELSDWSR